jgi:hypothetical protein
MKFLQRSLFYVGNCFLPVQFWSLKMRSSRFTMYNCVGESVGNVLNVLLVWYNSSENKV